MATIRMPAVAGSFYPAEPERLRTMVVELLDGANAAARPNGRRPKAVIAPHAGYVYSGPVAARAFATIGTATSSIDRVIVVGPAHFVAFRGIAAPSVDRFRTPLGDVPVDRSALAELPEVESSDRPHRDEHALEVELPFLQIVLGQFALVPLVVGQASAGEVAAALARLWGGDETLIVISSDLSHYEPYAAAQRHDTATAEAIEAFAGAELDGGDACGHLPIAGLLLEAQRRGLEVERLDLRNSGDTAGPKEQVVGYGAWAFHSPHSQAAA